MAHHEFNKELAQKYSKADWIKKLEHLKDEFDLGKIWDELQAKPVKTEEKK